MIVDCFCCLQYGSIGFISKCLINYRQHENANTNILKLDKKKLSPTIDYEEKMKAVLVELEIFSEFKFNKDKNFTKKLVHLYKKRFDSYVCMSLSIFMYKNFNSLLSIKKGTLSKVNFVFKHIWGIRIKQLKFTRTA